MDKLYHAYLGRKLVAKGDDLTKVAEESRRAIQNTGLNPWRGRHCGSVVIWDNISLQVIGIVTDDANAVTFRCWEDNYALGRRN